MTQMIQFRRGTKTELNTITPAAGEPCWTTDTTELYIGDGATQGGVSPAALSSDATIVVRPLGTPTENAQTLRDAYAEAITTSPGGVARSALNRVVVLVLPGVYDFATGDGSNNGLVMDTEFVDLIGLTSEPSEVVITSQIATASRGTLQQTADNVKIANLTLEITDISLYLGNSTDPAAYFPGGDLTATIMNNVNVIFDSNPNSRPMRTDVNYAGTYIGVISNGFNSFGHNAVASGTFIDCVAVDKGFGKTDASGTFIRCVGADHCFGWDDASGTFIDCKAGDNSFGFQGNASGTFIRCEGNSYCFGFEGTASGEFTDCHAGLAGFGAVGGGDPGTASGTFTRCTAEWASFGYNGTVSGTFIDCEGGDQSFNSTSGQSTAVMVRCRSIARTTAVKNFAGRMEDCVFEATTTNINAVEVLTGARIYDSLLVSHSGGYSISALSATQTVKVAHCRMNTGIYTTNVTNQISTPYNVTDSNVIL